MIATVLITILVEGLVGVIYARTRRKPALPILLTSVFGNLLTQSILWTALTLSYRRYLMSLAFAEIIIWGIESLLFYAIPANQLKLREAAWLSLSMNVTSLLLGWLLPV